MQLKNRDIITIINGLAELQKLNVFLPGRIGWTMKQNKKRLMNEYANYEESLKSIEAEENSDEWSEQVKELLNAEAEVPIATVDPSILFNKDYDPILFDALDFMLEDAE